MLKGLSLKYNEIMNINITKHKLEGGGSVDVHKVFGEECFIAIANIENIYPGNENIAKDVGRSEYLYILEGNFSICVNDKNEILGKDEHLLISDGDTYEITGQGRILVFVKDETGGSTEIIAK